jgi:hypothetical protein
MGYKTTTDVYALRAESTLTVADQNDSDVVEIATNLDSLSREVLLVWEVDFQFPTLGTQWGDIAGETTTDTFLHQLSIGKSNEAVNLNDPECIAIAQRVICGSQAAPNRQMFFTESYSPDSQNFESNVSANSPLGIIVGDKIFFRNAQSNDIALGSITADTLKGRCRLMVQRAKADADTYSAILQGYSI